MINLSCLRSLSNDLCLKCSDNKICAFLCQSRLGMDNLLKDGWFSEKNELWPGQYLSLHVEKVLHTERTKYQEIAILQTKQHGRVLVLDGIIQCSERDEFSYQEMMALVPLCAHPKPRKVLIVGGGDGGVARDVAKHPLVEEIHLVEIDQRVIEVSKQYLPHMAIGFTNPKLRLHIADGSRFMSEHVNEFDVIITDSGDPVGPNEPLFQEDYFGELKKALRAGGLVCSQASTPWIDLGKIGSFVAACRKHFPIAKYGVVSVPTYPTGQIGFIIGAGADPAVPQFQFTEALCEKAGLRYYDTNIHKAAFVLPRFVRAHLSKFA